MSTDNLTLKQQRWEEAYWQTGNMTEAARIAGYKGDDRTLGVVGFENLRKSKIKQHILERIDDAKTLTGPEVIGTLADQMRGNAADIFDEKGALRLEDIRRKKLGHLIKKFKCRRVYEKNGDGDSIPVDLIEVELHNPQAAAIQLCKVMGLEAPQKLEINVTTNLVIAFHAQINAMVLASADPEQVALELARTLMMPAEEFAARLAESVSPSEPASTEVVSKATSV